MRRVGVGTTGRRSTSVQCSAFASLPASCKNSQPSPSYGTDSRSLRQQIHSLVWNIEIYYRIHRSLWPVLGQLVHQKSISSSQICISLLNNSSFRVQTIRVYKFLIFVLRASHLAHLHSIEIYSYLLDRTNYCCT